MQTGVSQVPQPKFPCKALRRIAGSNAEPALALRPHKQAHEPRAAPRLAPLTTPLRDGLARPPRPPTAALVAPLAPSILYTCPGSTRLCMQRGQGRCQPRARAAPAYGRSSLCFS